MTLKSSTLSLFFVIELEEGAKLTAQLVDCDVDNLEIETLLKWSLEKLEKMARME